jgi:hypothetical protein
MAALGGEKVVITAPQAVGIAPADFGPGLIDRAASLVAVEKLADRFEDVVFLMAEHSVAIRYLDISLFDLLDGYTEVFCQTLDVSLVDIDPVIATAIGRAFQTIEEHAQRTAVSAGFTSICFAHPHSPRTVYRFCERNGFYHARAGQGQMAGRVAALA